MRKNRFIQRHSFILLLFCILLTQLVFAGTVTTLNQADFNLGTYNSVFFNTTLGAVQLNQTAATFGTYTSTILDAGSIVDWKEINWGESFPQGDEQTTNVNEAGAGAVNASNLVGLWHFNGNLNGVVGTNSNFTQQSTIINTTDYVFGSGAFGNPSTSYAYTSGNTYQISDKWTLSLWVKKSESTSSAQHTVISTDSSWNANSGWRISFPTGAGAAFKNGNGGSYTYYYYPSVEDSNFLWHHYVVTYDARNITLYLDGRYASSTVQASAATGSTQPLTLGGTASSGGFPFRGSIDELIIWNRTITPSEVQNLYQRGIIQTNLSIRSCPESTCSGIAYTQGLTNATNNTLTLPHNRYFQYVVAFTTLNTTYTSNLFNVTTTFITPMPFSLTRFLSSATSSQYNQFNGTFGNMQTNSTGYIGLSPTVLLGNYTSAIFNASSPARWQNITYTLGAPYGREVPTAPETFSNGVNTTSLVGLWHLNDRIATIGYNITLNGTTATLNTSDKRFGNASLTISGGSAEIPAIYDINEAGWTVSLWLLKAEATGSGEHGILRTDTNWNSVDGWRLTFPTSANPAIKIANGATYTYYYYPSLEESNFVWHHLAATYQNKEVVLYLDGQLVNNNTLSNTHVAGQRVLTLGVGGGSGIGSTLRGNLDEIAIWNRTLAPTEINNLYKRGAVNFNVSVRSCDDAACSGESFSSVLTNTTTVSISPANNTYFQYLIQTSTLNRSVTPELYNLTIEYALQNRLPTQSTPFLNSSKANNNTYANLTVYNLSTSDNDGHAVKNIIDWRVNNVSYALLNFPFEKTTNTTNSNDYSTRSKNGTFSGATLVATGGYDERSAYSFDGINDLLDVADTTINNNETYIFWIKPASLGSGFGNVIVNLEGGLANDRAIYHSITGGITKKVGDFGGGHEQGCSGMITVGNWTHVAIVQQDMNITMYRNGALACSVNYSASIPTVNVFKSIGQATTSRGYFNGTLDDFQWYNRSLSAAQVRMIYNNQTNMIDSAETTASESWSACITPNDGTEDGQTLCSNQFTISSISDADLIINASIVISPSSPYQGQSLLFNTTIHNPIAADSLNINISLYIDNVITNSTFITNLSALSSQEVLFSWNATPSTRQILIAVDPTNAISESNETNNNVTTTLLVNTLTQLNLTTPSEGIALVKGGGTTNEDPESYVPDLTFINVSIYNTYNLNQGINATCLFMINSTILGTNYTSPAGNCQYSFDQTTITPNINHTLFVNFSNLSSGYISDSHNINQTILFSTTKYELHNSELNLRGSSYANGDAAVLQLNITRDGVLYDPVNITVFARRSSPDLFVNAFTYPGNLIKVSTGIYQAVQVINSSFSNTAIHWKIYTNDNQTLNGQKQATIIPVTSGSHADIDILPESSALNFTFINETGSLTSTLYLSDRNGYTLEHANITTSYLRPGTSNESYSVTLTATNASITIRDLNSSNNITLMPQLILNYTGIFPAGTTNLTSVLAVNSSTFNFTNATIMIPTNGRADITTIYRCTDWDFALETCNSWASSSISSYPDFTSNATFMTFTVSSFSAYAGGSIGDNANLTINNNGPKLPNQNVTFNATYLNLTTNSLISGAQCIISTSDTSVNHTMTEYADRYEYSASISAAGAYTYTVWCTSTGYTSLTATDNVTINAFTPPGITSIQNSNSSAGKFATIFLNWTLSDNANLASTWIQIRNSTGTFNATPQILSSTNGVGNYTYTINDPRTTNLTFIAFVNDTENSINTTAPLSFIVQNSLPGSPSINAPSNNTNFTYVLSGIALNWTNVSDTDGDTIAYILQISNTSSFSTLEHANMSVPQNTPLINTLIPLLQNGTHYWRVLATDLVGNSSYTPIIRFNTTTTPFAITLNTPLTVQPVQKLQTTLNVTLSTTGALWYSLDSGTNISLCASCTQNTTFLNFTSYGAHTLHVFANDTFGQTTNQSIIFSLVLDTDGNGTADSSFPFNDDDSDGVPNMNDTLNGNVTNLNTNFIATITINGSSDLSQQFNGVLTVNLTNGTNTLLAFDYNFSANQTLTLGNISVIKQNDSVNTGSLLVHGINLTSEQTKTLFIEDLNTNKNGLCIKDLDINSIDNITSDCTGADETKLSCSVSGITTGNYTCTTLGSFYKLEGAQHTIASETSITTSSTNVNNNAGGGGHNSGRSGTNSFSVIYPKHTILLQSIPITIKNNGYRNISEVNLTFDTVSSELNYTLEPTQLVNIAQGATANFTLTFFTIKNSTAETFTIPFTIRSSSYIVQGILIIHNTNSSIPPSEHEDYIVSTPVRPKLWFIRPEFITLPEYRFELIVALSIIGGASLIGVVSVLILKRRRK